jgi:hypothetical protein
MLWGQHISTTKLILRQLFLLNFQLRKLSKENAIVSMPIFSYPSVPLTPSYRTLPLYRSICDYQIIRVYLTDPSRCSDFSLGINPSCSCHGWDIFSIVSFGFWLFPSRGWRQSWFSAEYPQMVVHTTASTLAIVKSWFYQRRGNSL